MSARCLLIASVAAAALLYSCLTPLWEGFDEPFHFGYVQQLANLQGLPHPPGDLLSEEVKASLLLAPSSPVVQRNLPQLTSFSQYFAWPPEKRSAARRALYALPVSLRLRPSAYINYETQQAPLAYLLMAPLERMMAAARLPLPSRVLALRIVVALAGCALLYFAADRLFRQLAMPPVCRDAALFCVFTSQMLWATVAHVANDWLAVPLAVWTLFLLTRCRENPDTRTASFAAVVFAAGLLTKAYFLALIPLFLFVCAPNPAAPAAIVIFLAGPWYARNLLLYGTLSGTQEARAGFGLRAAIAGVHQVDWFRLLPAYIRASLWTGNSTFLAFSAGTLDLLAALLFLSLILWALRRREPAGSIVAAYCASFALAIAYATVITNITIHGAALTAEPWYAQVLAAPLFGLVWLSGSRWLGIALVALQGYIMELTFVAKLIPLYGGYEGRGSLQAMFGLYGHGLSRLTANLDSVSLAPAGVILALACLVVVLTLAQQVILIARLRREDL